MGGGISKYGIMPIIENKKVAFLKLLLSNIIQKYCVQVIIIIFIRLRIFGYHKYIIYLGITNI